MLVDIKTFEMGDLGKNEGAALLSELKTDLNGYLAQMPAGVAVGTLAIGTAGAKNAALLAASVVGLHDIKVRRAVEEFRKRQTRTVLAQKLP